LRSHFVRPRGLRSGSCFIACLVSPLFLALFAAAAPAAPAESLVRITQLEDARAATDELRAFLGSDDASTRARAALALGRIGHPPDVAVLAPLLRDGQVEVRRTAAFALGEIEDSTAARALAAWLESGDEEDAEARALAVEAFGKLKAEPSTCQRALRDRSPRARSVRSRARTHERRRSGSPVARDLLSDAFRRRPGLGRHADRGRHRAGAGTAERGGGAAA